MNILPKILVTGANGQLGKELQELAKTTTGYEFVFTPHNELPVDEAIAVNEAVQKIQPGFLVNCAAYTAVDKAETEKEKAFRINGEAPGILAKACKKNNCRFIHISTDYVFSGEGTLPYKETDATGPKGVYGASKLMGEENAMANNPETIIIRTSWVYSQYGHNFVKTMLRLMNEKESISVVNDQQGSPTWAAGLAKAILHLIERIHHNRASASGVYHYCDEGITNWYEFALAIKEYTGSPCKVLAISTAEYPTPAKRPAWSALDTEKIVKEQQVDILPWKTQLQNCLQQLSATATGNLF